MAYRRKRNARRKFPAKRNYMRKAAVKYANKRIARVCKKVISRNIETKVLQVAGSINGRALQATTTNAEFYASTYCLTPQGGTIGTFTGGYAILGNGIGEDQRVGNECRIKGTYFNYQILAQPYNATTNTVPAPQIVTLFFVKPKAKNGTGLSPDQVLSGANAIFYENVTNADSGMTGSLLDDLRKIDRDNFQVVAIRQHKIGYDGNLNTSNQLNTLPTSAYTPWAKGRVKMGPYIWKVDRNESFQGRNVYVIVHSVRADGTTVVSNQIPVVVNFNHAVYFQDA